MFRREVYADIGGFDESLATAEDLDFHLRIARRWQIGVIEEALARAIRGRYSEEVDAEEQRLAGSSRAGVRHQAALVALELLLP